MTTQDWKVVLGEFTFPQVWVRAPRTRPCACASPIPGSAPRPSGVPAGCGPHAAYRLGPRHPCATWRRPVSAQEEESFGNGNVVHLDDDYFDDFRNTKTKPVARDGQLAPPLPPPARHEDGIGG